MRRGGAGELREEEGDNLLEHGVVLREAVGGRGLFSFLGFRGD